MNRLPVKTPDKRDYDIVLDQGFENLGLEIDRLELAGRKVLIVTDTNVGPLYLEELTAVLTSKNITCESFTLKAGEESKTQDNAMAIQSVLIENNYKRTDIVVALGGGVVGDISGYVASVYHRGLIFIQIPTTLLSMVDSSVGGKNGVDYNGIKNVLGTFYNPSLVYMNLKALLTLEERQFFNGFAEAMKSAIIKNASYYEWLIENMYEICDRDLDVCEDLVLKSITIKKIVVEKDCYDTKGERALLNLGHTIVAMTVADVVGDLLNVYLFNGGVFGMGLATSISYFISAAILMAGLISKNTLMRISIKTHISKEKGTLLSIINRGLPKATKRACNSLRPIIVNRLIVATAGEIAMVAMSVECTIRYIPESIGVGLSGAALMLVGIFLGEMDYHSLKEMKKTYRVLIGVGVTLLSVIYFLASDFLAQLYITPDSPSYQLTVNILRCHAVSLPFLAYNECRLSCLQAMGKMLITHIFTVIQRLVCIIGLSYFLGFFFGVDGIWYAIPLSEVIVAVIIAFCSKVISPSKKKNEPVVIGDFSESLTEINQIPTFLDRIDDFLKRYDIDKQKSYYVYLFCEEISNLVLQKGFDDKKSHQLDIRIIYIENEITVRTRDDCLHLSDIEKSDKCSGAPDDPLLGFHMVFKLAKKVEYYETMNINHLIIRL